MPFMPLLTNAQKNIETLPSVDFTSIYDSSILPIVSDGTNS